jgi:uncharacterized protein (DUF302 family)/uncharacterized membrane protein YidH (DUF202 family)
MMERTMIGPADYLAAERTFLAWIRTGLALMGFGFVVARFGLFLEALQVGQASLAGRPNGFSVWFGTALLVLGVSVNILAAWRHVRLIRELRRGGSDFHGPSSLAVAVALILAAVGLAMAVYLTSVRETRQVSVGAQKEISMAPHSESGIVTLRGNHSVDQTVEQLEKALQEKGVKLFAVVDHSGEAKKVGMSMPSTKLLIFGHPKAGTPLMLASPGIAIDLPLKILVAEDSHGQVWISYNSPSYLQARHALPPELVLNIAVVETLAKSAAQ